MSIKIIKSQIIQFLKSDSSEVIAIRGKWGVGKTFFWKKTLIEAQRKKIIKLDKYSYVSLFGINSIEALKFSIFEQMINKELIGEEASIQTFKSNADTLLKSLGQKSVTLFQNAPVVKNFGPAINSISFLSLNKILICIDDFERKGNYLSTKDVMGLISVLKEQKNCKIALILNDELFDKKAKEDYKLFREKCIDIELEFHPAAEECVNIAIGSDKYSDDFSTKLKEFIVTLSINNIRIIKRIERVADLLRSCLYIYEPEVVNQALHTLTLFSFCYYTNDEISPNYDYVKNLGTNMFNMLDDNKEEETDEEKRWKEVLRKYDYQHSDEFDLQIAKTVETGFIDKDTLLPEAERQNNQFLKTKSINSFRDAWRLYHDSFDDNEEELIQNLRECISKIPEYIGPDGLNSVVELFRDLNKDKIADETIEQYIKARKSDKDLFDLSRYPFRKDISDPKINIRFDEIYESNEEKKSIKTVLKSIDGKNGWGGNDEKILANASTDEYYQLFKTEKGRHLSTYINKCLMFGRLTNASDTGKTIAKNVTIALERIGKESRLNTRRISKFGIKLSKE